MRLKEALLDIRVKLGDGSYRSGLCVIKITIPMSFEQSQHYSKLLASVLPTNRIYPIPSGNPSIPNDLAYRHYNNNTPLEGFDMEAYKARRLKILDKVIELCD